MIRQTAEQIEQEAADWVARIDRGLSPVEQATLDRWLEADPRRLGAFGRLQAVAIYTRRARALSPDYDPAQFEAEPAPSYRPSRRLILGGGAALAAGVAGALAVGLGLTGRGQGISTGLGEIRALPLPDGSTMTLNTDSRVRVAFSDGERRVQLLEGEVLFDVAKDAARPFIVSANGTDVRAVGTSFTVRKLADAPVQVLVREGIVEVKPRIGPAARLVANTRAVATGKGSDTVAVTPIAEADLGRALAWRDGRIAFEGDTLAEAAAEFARYSDTRIVIDDPAVAREQVAGLFQANDPVGFARAIATAFDLEAEVTDGSVRLSRRG